MAELSGTVRNETVGHPTRWRVAVTQREQRAAPGREACDALDAGYAPWLLDLLVEALVLPIPNLADPTQALAQADAIGVNALVLSGGGDLDTQPRREAIERALLTRAASERWPVIGICRGMQMLQRHSGGEIVRLQQTIGEKHAVTDLSSRPADATSAQVPKLIERAMVNSWHHYGILEPASGWQALARADDGSIEAMRHLDLPWLALMWHPERADGGAALCLPWLHSLFHHRVPPSTAHPIT